MPLIKLEKLLLYHKLRRRLPQMGAGRRDEKVAP